MLQAITQISMQGMILMFGLIRAFEGSFKIDWLQTRGPVFDRSSIWLRRLLIGSECRLSRISRSKLEPTDPRAVGSFFTKTAHGVSGVVSTNHGGCVFL